LSYSRPLGVNDSPSLSKIPGAKLEVAIPRA
jgi:hypothetical protein